MSKLKLLILSFVMILSLSLIYVNVNAEPNKVTTNNEVLIKDKDIVKSKEYKKEIVLIEEKFNKKIKKYNICLISSIIILTFLLIFLNLTIISSLLRFDENSRAFIILILLIILFIGLINLILMK